MRGSKLAASRYTGRNGVLRYEKGLGHTNSTAIRGTSDDVVIQVKIQVKHFGVMLYAPIPFVTQPLPACPRMSCVHPKLVSLSSIGFLQAAMSHNHAPWKSYKLVFGILGETGRVG